LVKEHFPVQNLSNTHQLAENATSPLSSVWDSWINLCKSQWIYHIVQQQPKSNWKPEITVARVERPEHVRSWAAIWLWSKATVCRSVCKWHPRRLLCRLSFWQLSCCITWTPMLLHWYQTSAILIYNNGFCNSLKQGKTNIFRVLQKYIAMISFTWQGVKRSVYETYQFHRKAH